MEQAIAATPGATIDYAAVVDPDTLEPVGAIDRAALLAVAVRFGDTRLIDNTTVGAAS
jgi:pantoate--beta-alanine ligase